MITAQGVLISAEAQAQVKVSSDEGDLHRAVENFLSRGASGITYVAQEVLEGHMRAVLGGMTVEEIYTEREEVAERLRRQADPDFRRLGLELVSFSLKDIADAQGYIAAIGARRLAEIKRDAAIAQAETERDAAINAAEARKEGDVARLRAEAELAEATRDFEMRRADYQAAVNTKRAQADLAYDLERAKGELVLRQEEYRVRLTEKELAAKVEQAEVIRREQELEANVKRPAEAMQFQARLEAETEAYKKELEAKGRAAGVRLDGASQAEAIAAKGKAEAEAMRQKAEAWKQYSEAAMAEMVIKVLPELARSVSEPLSKVEKIVMVGDDAGGAEDHGAGRPGGRAAPDGRRGPHGPQARRPDQEETVGAGLRAGPRDPPCGPAQRPAPTGGPPWMTDADGTRQPHRAFADAEALAARGEDEGPGDRRRRLLGRRARLPVARGGEEGGQGRARRQLHQVRPPRRDPRAEAGDRREARRDNGLSYSPDEIIVCPGAKNSLFNVALSLFEPGDDVLDPGPVLGLVPRSGQARRRQPGLPAHARGGGLR